MNARHQRFVELYCTDFNATKAALGAGYSERRAHVTGSELLKRPDVAEAVQARLSEMSMGPDEVLKRLTDIARLDVGEVVHVDPKTGEIKLDLEGLAKNKRFLNEFGYDSNGLPKLKFHDSLSALRDLGRAHKLFTDRQELSGPNGGAIPVEMKVVFVDAENE